MRHASKPRLSAKRVAKRDAEPLQQRGLTCNLRAKAVTGMVKMVMMVKVVIMVKVVMILVRVPNLYFGSRLGEQYPKNSKIFL